MDNKMHTPVHVNKDYGVLGYNTGSFLSWTLLVKRASKLKISRDELAMCKTLSDVKKLARKRFIEIARQTHPDLRPEESRYHRSGHCEGKEFDAKGGVSFKQCQKTYKWFCEIDESMFDRMLKIKQSVPDPELPMDWSGWQAYDSYYEGYRVYTPFT